MVNPAAEHITAHITRLKAEQLVLVDERTRLQSALNEVNAKMTQLTAVLRALAGKHE